MNAPLVVTRIADDDLAIRLGCIIVPSGDHRLLAASGRAVLLAAGTHYNYVWPLDLDALRMK